ncbi:cupin domain-containing protein [Aureivirga sp. CE67]|uniref:cupin domain-containing protein n=1 Tax=Aureivirga sp. CE67 TaxID=1788983 RepID=UPI0018CBBFD3|nr:cupin domain-containing protein [Aureivirga sp. CE67]
MTASYFIDKFEMLPHPEGGFYKEVYRSEGTIPKEVLGKEFSGDRNYATGIYYLLKSENFSAFHKINQDETWHYYSGSPVIVHTIDKEGNYHTQEVGLEGDAIPQYVVPAGVWFAATVKDENTFSFVGCTVAPGFDFEDFQLAERNYLVQEYPKHEEIITKLTR